MKTLQLGLFGLFAVLLFVPSPALGAPIIVAGIVDTEDTEDSVFPVDTFAIDPGNADGVHRIGLDESYEFFEYYSYNDLGDEEGYVYMTGLLDPDPVISFAITAIDSGAPSSFTFSYVMPLSPLINNPSKVFDSLSGSVTNGTAAGSLTVTALAPPPGIPTDGTEGVELQVYTLSDDYGMTWQNVGLDAGSTTTYGPGFPAFASALYPSTPPFAYNQGPIATIPGGPWTHMRVDINFRLSGGGDSLTINGAKVLVPEPGTLCIALSAVALCGLFRRRATSC